MNSDVSSDYSDDESCIKPSREIVQNVFNEKASKGWATCADGFEKYVKIKKNCGFKVRQKLAVTPSSSSVNIKNKPSTTVHKKKNLQKKCHKTIELEDIRSCQASKENVHRDPLVAINNPFNCSSPIPDFCLDFLKNESVPKIRKSKNWTFTDLSNSFSALPDQKKAQKVPFHKKKMSLENDFLMLDAIKCSSQLDDVNAVETDHISPCSSQKEECSEVISFSTGSSLLQEKGKNCECTGVEKSDKRTVNISQTDCIERYQNSFGVQSSENSTMTAIATTTSSPNPSVVKKGSDWLKGIAWNKKEDDDPITSHTDESGISKNKKFVPGGFAEQVSKLEKKERSSRLIWSHKKREKSVIGLEKCITVRVGPCCALSGMLLSKCTILKSPIVCDNEKSSLDGASHSISLKPETDFIPNPLNDRNLALNASEISPLAKGTSENVVSNIEHCFLLLKPSIMHDFKFGNDSTIRIYPPWQFLHVRKNSYPFILGAYFIEVLDSPVLPQVAEPVSLAMEEILFINNYNDSVTQKTDVPVQTPVRRKTRSKERKRLYNVDKATDIRKYLKKPDQDCVKDSENTIVVQTSKQWEMPITPIVFDNVNQCELDYDDSVLETYSVCATTFSLCARVQRVWQYAISSHKFRRSVVSGNVIESSEIRYSLLIQDRKYRFFELQLSNFGSISDNDSWNELLHQGEGHCFMFDAVKISRKLCLSKYPAFFTLLKTIGRNQQIQKESISTRLQPTLCYQLAVNCRNSTALNISDHMYPPYVSYAISSLASLTKMPKSPSRFSCFAKVLCEVNRVFYITDKSLQRKTSSPYVKMSFCSSGVQPSSLNSTSEILITEAVVQEDLLFVDKYAMVIPISFAKNNCVVPFVNKPVSFELAKELSTLSSGVRFWKKLQDSSNVGDIVKVQGKILSVNANTAISWLECSICGKENLYQDSSSRIFCNFCRCIVKSPNLKMKMEVSVLVSLLPNAVITLELTCATTKKILQVPEGVSQPKCNINDVLNKKIGPCVCLVENVTHEENKTKFKLQEVIFS